MTEQDGTSEADDAEQHAEESTTETADAESPADAEQADMSAPSEQDSQDAEQSDRRAEGTAGIDVSEDTSESATDLDVADDIVEYVESTPPEAVADEIATLRFEVDTLESDVAEYEQEIEDLQARLKRKQADFENYKKRMKKRREEEQARATENLVTRLLDVRDNLTRALEQDEDTDIRDGIESTLKQFDRVLEEENVEAIEPQPGDEVDPERHEVLVRMNAEQPAGTIAQVHRPGYEMAGKVIRTAQVAVSEE
jgi:molecular chaperone GrpE